MKKEKLGLTLLELLIILAIIGVIAGIAIPLIRGFNNKWYGRNIDTPLAGRIYKVTAADKEVNEVIAMPWKYREDEIAPTDRRLLLKVSSNVCETGIWFLAGDDEVYHIIAPPISESTKTNSVTKVEKVYELNK